MPSLSCLLRSSLAVLALLPLAAAGNPVEALRHPTLGPAQHVEGAILSIGHAQVTFTGEFAPLRVDGRPVGIFLAGQGSLAYASAFAPEAPVFTRNLKDWTQVPAGATASGVAVSIPFQDATFYWGGAPQPTWTGPERPGTLEPALARHAKAFAGVFGFDPCQGLAFQAANAPAAAYVVAELGDGSRRWIYCLDSADRQMETLAWLEPEQLLPSGPDVLSVVELSRQPIGWDPRRDLAPVAHQIRELDLELRTRDNTNLELTVRETLATGVAGHRLLNFRLKETFIGQKSLYYLKMKRVTDGQGRELAFDQRAEHLLVQLPVATDPARPIVLNFEYGGNVLLRPGGDNYWELAMNEGWYPSFETLPGENFSFHGTVRTGGGWTAQLPGEVVRRVKEGDLELVETRSSKPISMVTVLGGKYFMEEETRDGLTVRIATYAAKLGVARKTLMDQAFNVIAYYKPFLGPFPFKEFTIVERNDWGYGQAPAGMMYITKEAFMQLQYHRMVQEFADAQDGPNRAIQKTMNITHVFAHEIAHQFWGTIVKMPSWEDQWLTEAFADYCATLYERDFKGKDYYKGNINGYFTSANFSSGLAPIALANNLLLKDRSLRFSHRRNLLYSKGPALLYALHQELGDETFLTWFKSIQSNFRWNYVTTKRVFELLNFITKRDHAPFLNRYFWGLEMPPKKGL